MRIYYASDLHTEFGLCQDKFTKARKKDILILAGDCFTHRQMTKTPTAVTGFIKQVVKNFKAVYYLPGNHEYYYGSIDGTNTMIDEVIGKLGVYIIKSDNSFRLDDNVLLVGGTLWTNMNNSNPVVMDIAKYSMNDFAGAITAFTPQESVRLHERFLNNITAVVETNPHCRIVVATHHAPTQLAVSPGHTGSSLNYAYYTDLTEFIQNRPNIKAWIYGHTHVRREDKIGECKVVSNARGYVFHESLASDFKFNKFLEV